MNIALILSGGMGVRFGKDTPKQYQILVGKWVIAYTIEALKASTEIDKIIAVTSDNYLTTLTDQYKIESVICGNSRNESLRRGLEYINANYPNCDKVFINEAARPFITSELVDKYVKLLGEYDAVITAKHITDSLGKEGQHITDRSQYYLIQAPEAFRFRLLYENFQADSPITATVQQMPPESKVYRNFDFRNNLKITYPEDLELAEFLMRCQS